MNGETMINKLGYFYNNEDKWVLHFYNPKEKIIIAIGALCTFYKIKDIESEEIEKLELTKEERIALNVIKEEQIQSARQGEWWKDVFGNKDEERNDERK